MAIVPKLRNPDLTCGPSSSDLWLKGFFTQLSLLQVSSSLTAMLRQGGHDIYLLFIWFACSRPRLILTNAQGLELHLQIQLNVQVCKKQEQFNSRQ